jgi:hypothetical protein
MEGPPGHQTQRHGQRHRSRVQGSRRSRGDGASRDSTDFKNLLRLASQAAPKVFNEVLALRTPALLIRPGLLARYGLLEEMEKVAQTSGASGGPPSLWLLISQPGPGRPQIDGHVLGVISAANWARLTDPWLANAHRAGGRSAA